jgi:molybdopterin-guanine dinucleotide biosynthesis protein B
MIGIQIVGSHHSGKSTLAAALAARLKAKGVTVAVVKHACHPLILNPKEEKALGHAGEVHVLSDGLTLSVTKHPLQLLQVLSRIEAEVVIVEGFKTLGLMPRLLCVRTVQEKRAMASGLEIAVFGPGESAQAKKLDRTAAAVLRRGFVLPGVNCHKCGFRTCAGLAAAIVAGKRKAADCTVLDETTRLVIDGQTVALSPFVADILKSTCWGFVKSLKGVTRGNVRIEFEP